LRIIELFELDYNGMLKYLIGKRFAYFEQSRGLQNPETYGAVKKKNTHDALESVLTSLDYSRIMRKPMMIAPKDATGCFDLLRAEAIRSIQESKGMPRGINACRISVLQNMERHVKTAGKISSRSIKYSEENTIGGVGIGAGSGPQDSNDQYGVLKDVHAEITPGFTYQHPSGAEEESDTRHGPSFIDDQIDMQPHHWVGDRIHFRYGKTCYTCQGEI